MQVVTSGVELCFEVTFDSDTLDVGMAILDVTSGSPVLVDTIAMTLFPGTFTYYAKFTPDAGKFIVNKAVYTDESLAEINTAYPQGSDSITAVESSGPVKNSDFPGFTFPMFDLSGTPKTGLTVTAQRTIDGAALAACTNAVTEVGGGYYKIDLAAADMNGSSLGFKMTATGALATLFELITQ